MNNIRKTIEGISETNQIIEDLSSENVLKTCALEWNSSCSDLAQDLISTVYIENSTTIKKSGLANADLLRYDINPNCKISEYAEVGSQVGFEILSRMTFYDQDNKFSIRDQDFTNIGTAIENKGLSSQITYIILADSTVDDLAPGITRRISNLK